jgi:hypothetical protein
MKLVIHTKVILDELIMNFGDILEHLQVFYLPLIQSISKKGRLCALIFFYKALIYEHRY